MPNYNKPPFGPALPYGSKYGGVRPDSVGDFDLVLLLDKDMNPVDPRGTNGSLANGALWKNDNAKFVRYASNHPIYQQGPTPAPSNKLRLTIDLDANSGAAAISKVERVS